MDSLAWARWRFAGTEDDELFAIGLGSCIGLALVDCRARVAGLAHIVLPESAPGEDAEPANSPTARCLS